MISKNPFLKYVNKGQKEDIFHSSAYGKAQSGGNMGAASTESFAVRVNINQNRQSIRSYSDSELVTEVRNQAPKAKPYIPPEKPKNPGILPKR